MASLFLCYIFSNTCFFHGLRQQIFLLILQSFVLSNVFQLIWLWLCFLFLLIRLVLMAQILALICRKSWCWGCFSKTGEALFLRGCRRITFVAIWNWTSMFWLQERWNLATLFSWMDLSLASRLHSSFVKWFKRNSICWIIYILKVTWTCLLGLWLRAKIVSRKWINFFFVYQLFLGTDIILYSFKLEFFLRLWMDKL